MRLIPKLITALIKGYQLLVSPYLGHHCRFTPTCSYFALEAFKKYPLHKALIISVRRLSKCHPWHPGGYDPVP